MCVRAHGLKLELCLLWSQVFETSDALTWTLLPYPRWVCCTHVGAPDHRLLFSMVKCNHTSNDL